LRIPFVDLAAQRAKIAGEIDEAIRGCLDRNDWILGRDVAAFEDELAAYCGTTGAVGTDSGLSALDLTLRACGIGPGDEVITAANTFVATALAIVSAGATPVLVDADPETFNLDPSMTPQQIESMMGAAQRLGWQMCSHVTGDAGVDLVLDALAQVNREIEDLPETVARDDELFAERFGAVDWRWAIEWRESDDHVLMTGPVEFEFEGKLSAAMLAEVTAG
jgi:hypothetical protein